MTDKKVVKSIRLDALLEKRIKAYCREKGDISESTAIRDLLEKGLACESLSLFATPVGSLIRDVISAEFALLYQGMEDHENQMEERIARTVHRGTRAALATQAQINDISRAIIPAWRDQKPDDLWKHYSEIGGKLSRGISYKEARE